MNAVQTGMVGDQLAYHIIDVDQLVEFIHNEVSERQVAYRTQMRG